MTRSLTTTSTKKTNRNTSQDLMATRCSGLSILQLFWRQLKVPLMPDASQVHTPMEDSALESPGQVLLSSLPSSGPTGFNSTDSTNSFPTSHLAERTISKTGTQTRPPSSLPGAPTDGCPSMSLSLSTMTTSLDSAQRQLTLFARPTPRLMLPPTCSPVQHLSSSRGQVDLWPLSAHLSQLA